MICGGATLMAEWTSVIQGLSARYTNVLNDLHDDYIHTGTLGRDIQVSVLRRKRKLKVVNPITKSEVNGIELANKAHSAILRLGNRCFKDIVAQVELFVTELIRFWLHKHPGLISEKAITVAVLFASPTLEDAQNAAVEEAIDSTISDKMYGRPEKWFAYLKKNLGVQFAVQDELDFVEMKARRDVLEHNNGIIEAVYSQKAKNASKYVMGVQVQITDQDIDDAYQLVKRLIREASEVVIAKSNL